MGEKMAKDIKADEFITGSDVVDKIERIGSLATLGNWAKEMERNGHSFQHDGRGRRIYSEEDMQILEEMNRLLGDRHTLKQAVQVTLGMEGKDVNNDNSNKNQPMIIDASMKNFIETQTKDMQDMKTLMTKLVEQNQTYQEENTKLEKKIDDLAEQSKKMLEAPEKKGWWARHFG
ncbi:hypothetical protein IV79_GL000562 [Pediococcus claussenii]|nr:hypothetical protein IV79_GL000562 [Pediococcus claussenii]